MSDRPTPETDTQIFEAWDNEGHYSTWVVDADFARRLERQRDEWHGAFILATKRAGDAGELLVELKRQRDELLEALESLLQHRPRADWEGLTIAEGLTWDDAEDLIAAVKGGEK
jgi:hypothetical protein